MIHLDSALPIMVGTTEDFDFRPRRIRSSEIAFQGNTISQVQPSSSMLEGWTEYSIAPFDKAVDMFWPRNLQNGEGRSGIGDD